MKLGIIRCMQTEDYCPGSRDFRTIRERKGAFMGEDDIQLVGFINCGGCPGKKFRNISEVKFLFPSAYGKIDFKEEC